MIEHPSLSKRHCLLVKTDGLLVIRDLATTNGTKVKGQRVRWAALLPEDRVSFGAYKVRIYLGFGRYAGTIGTATGTQWCGRLARGCRGRNACSANLGPKVTERVSPSPQAPRILPPGFPEPSHDGTAAADWETAYGERLAGQGTGGAAPFERGFELIVDDDDDEIVELD